VRPMKLREQAGAGRPPKVRVCARLACGQLGGSLPHTWITGACEVDFGTEVPMLWGHVASCGLTRERRSRLSQSSATLRHRYCRTRDPRILDLLWRRGVPKKG
jgi:hypothetical protein